MAGNRANLSGNNITGVSGAQHGRQKNAQAMQRAGAAGAGAGQANFEFGSELGAAGATGATGAAGLTGASFGVGADNAAQKNAKAMQRAAQKAGK